MKWQPWVCASGDGRRYFAFVSPMAILHKYSVSVKASPHSTGDRANYFQLDGIVFWRAFVSMFFAIRNDTQLRNPAHESPSNVTHQGSRDGSPETRYKNGPKSQMYPILRTARTAERLCTLCSLALSGGAFARTLFRKKENKKAEPTK